MLASFYVFNPGNFEFWDVLLYQVLCGMSEPCTE